MNRLRLCQGRRRLWSDTCCGDRQLAGAGHSVFRPSRAELPSGAQLRHHRSIKRAGSAGCVCVYLWESR